jgi:hypothetical protein
MSEPSRGLGGHVLTKSGLIVFSQLWLSRSCRGCPPASTRCPAQFQALANTTAPSTLNRIRQAGWRFNSLLPICRVK